jgi:hypothetical protein
LITKDEFLTMPLTPFLPAAHLLRTASSLAVVAAASLLSACTASVPWDREYACSGQEQSRAFSASDAAPVPQRKEYVASVRFNVRSGYAMVKSRLVPVDAETDATRDETIHFRKIGPTGWIAGQFDEKANQLLLVEEQTLTVAGKPQQVRTTGQYVCRQPGGGPLV